MNKAHRDRVAFMRICSGKFERGQDVLHVQSGKKMALAAPQQLMAQDRSVVDEAYAGDIIGIFDPGVFSIGDTVCDPKHKCVFSGIPTFAPELFAVVRQKDTLKRKQFVKGVEQIAQEGAIQIFREPNAGMESVIVGVVGVLQFEVLEYRLKNEYNVEIICRAGLRMTRMTSTLRSSSSRAIPRLLRTSRATACSCSPRRGISPTRPTITRICDLRISRKTRKTRKRPPYGGLFLMMCDKAAREGWTRRTE